MLREISGTRQGSEDICRRWFSSGAMDLVAWLDRKNGLVAFHLCYDKLHAERAVVWRGESKVLAHLCVDDGESMPGKYKSSPILMASKKLPLHEVREKFLLESSELPPVILADVLAHLDAGKAIDKEDL